VHVAVTQQSCETCRGTVKHYALTNSYNIHSDSSFNSHFVNLTRAFRYHANVHIKTSSYNFSLLGAKIYCKQFCLKLKVYCTSEHHITWNTSINQKIDLQLSPSLYTHFAHMMSTTQFRRKKTISRINCINSSSDNHSKSRRESRESLQAKRQFSMDNV